MIGKRSHTISKSSQRHNGKLKDSILTIKQKAEKIFIEPDLVNIPIVKQCENAKLLPKYNSIITKSGDDWVSMDDLDQLQQDLEKLLSTSAVRIRYLLGEIHEIDKNEDNHERRSHDKTSLKRKRPEEKSKFKDVNKNGVRVNKKHNGLPVNKFINTFHQEIPKVTLPKNDNCDRFWNSIDPYCASITKEHIALLENLLQEFSKDINTRIPDLGEHYCSKWSQEVLLEEQNSGKTKSKTSNNDAKKNNNIQAVIDSFSIPQTQRLLAALLEEKHVKIPKIVENKQNHKKIKSADKNHFEGKRLNACLDRRLRRELLDQGIITIEDMAKYTPDDEILTEIKKCRQELAAVNEYNIEEITKLKTILTTDVQINALKNQLNKVDKQIFDLYCKIIEARKVAQKEGITFSEQIIKEYESQAEVLVKQQKDLNQEIAKRKSFHETSIFSESIIKNFECHSLLKHLGLR